MTSWPLTARARWIASMVDSVPEFVKRQWGRPQRRRSSPATAIECSVGAAKCVPASICFLTAAAMTGFACPTHMTPKPLWKSRYSLPSTSQTFAPCPRSTYTGHGSFFWNWDGTPPGITMLAREKYSPERRVRSISFAFSRSVSAATRAGSMAVSSSVVVMAATLQRAGVRLSPAAQLRAPDLAARRARQLGREVDDPRVLVGRGLGLDVLLQLAHQFLRRRVVLAQHDDRAHDAAALLVGRCHHGRLGDRGVIREHGLDLERADPVAGRDDHVVRPTLEVQEAVVVGVDAVAGVPRTAGRLVAEVAKEERRVGRRLQHELAVDDVERDAGQRPAHRAGARALSRRHAGELAGLGLAVAVADPQAGGVVPGFEHAGVERLACGHEA